MAEQSFRVETGSGRSETRSPVFDRHNRDGSSSRQMIASGTWLTNGSAMLDDHGRVIQSNDEFSSWAGSSTLVFPHLPELLENRCPGWSVQVQELLDLQEPFCEAYLEDTSVQPCHWYRLELASNDTTKFVRLCRCLPPLARIAE